MRLLCLLKENGNFPIFSPEYFRVLAVDIRGDDLDTIYGSWKLLLLLSYMGNSMKGNAQKY